MKTHPALNLRLPNKRALITLGILLGLAASSHGQIITSIVTDKDTYVRGGSTTTNPDTNYGNEQSLAVDSRAGSNNRIAYVGFTLPNEVIVADIADITKVEFQIYMSGRDANPITQDIGYSATGWGETTLTLNIVNADYPNLGTIASLSNTDLVVNSLIKVDVTAYVISALAANQTEVSLVIAGTSGAGAFFRSKERSFTQDELDNGAIHPTLEFTIVPELSTYALALGLLTLAGVLLRRRMTA